MTGRRWWVVGGMIAAWAAAGAEGAEPPPKGYVCTRAATPIVVDGAIDDPAWAAAPWTDDFVDIEGDKRPIPPLRTRAKLVWDADRLYIAAELVDPHVWANLTAHDSVIFRDNDFEVFLDPDGDNHKYFEVEINARNTEWDLFLPKPYRDNGSADNSWEIPGLQKAVRVLGTLNEPADVDTGWTVELAIPWRDLARDGRPPFAPHDGDRWRINFSRVEWDTTVADGKYVKVKEGGKEKPEHNWVWSPQGVVDMHQPERWGYLQFSTKEPGSAPYRADPAQPIRDRLMAIYHAERAFQKANGRWSDSFRDLGIAPDDLPLPTGRAASPSIRLTPKGYEAAFTSAPMGPEAGPTVWGAVDQDSLLSIHP